MNPLKESFEEVADCAQYLESKWGREVARTFGTLLQAFGDLATLPTQGSAADLARARGAEQTAEDLLLRLAQYRIAAERRQKELAADLPSSGPVVTYDASPPRPIRLAATARTTMPYDRSSLRGAFGWDKGFDSSRRVDATSLRTNMVYDDGRAGLCPEYDAVHGTILLEDKGHAVFSPADPLNVPPQFHAQLAAKFAAWLKARPQIRIRATLPIGGAGGQTIILHVWFDHDEGHPAPR